MGFCYNTKGMSNPTTPGERKTSFQSAEKGRKGVDPHERELLLQPILPLSHMKTSTRDPRTAGRTPYPASVPHASVTEAPSLRRSDTPTRKPGFISVKNWAFNPRRSNTKRRCFTKPWFQSFPSSAINQDILGHAVLGNLAWQAYKCYWWLFHSQPFFFHHLLPRRCCLQTKGNSLMQEFPGPELPGFKQMEWEMSEALVDEPSNGAAHSWSFEAEKSALCGLRCSDWAKASDKT